MRVHGLIYPFIATADAGCDPISILRVHHEFVSLLILCDESPTMVCSIRGKVWSHFWIFLTLEYNVGIPMQKDPQFEFSAYECRRVLTPDGSWLIEIGMRLSDLCDSL